MQLQNLRQSATLRESQFFKGTITQVAHCLSALRRDGDGARAVWHTRLSESAVLPTAGKGGLAKPAIVYDHFFQIKHSFQIGSFS